MNMWIHGEKPCTTFVRKIERKKVNNPAYNQTIITFDIETTSISKKVGKEKKHYAGMYHWQMMVNGVYFSGRTYDSLREAFEAIDSWDGIKIIWVHNLAFEFQFLCNIFGNDKVDLFARDSHKPIKAKWKSLEFRCTLFLTNVSLAQVPKNFGLQNCQKMVGDLDYGLVRTPNTPLTKEEQEYCYQDVLIVHRLIEYFLGRYGVLQNIPLTSTGTIRRVVKQRWSDLPNFERLKLREKITNALPDFDLFMMLRQAFMGGYTHANVVNARRTIKNVDSYDITSSYPTVMIAEKYPYKLNECFVKGKPKIDTEDRAYLMKLKLTNVVCKGNHNNHYWSVSKGNNKGVMEDNGRVVTAEEMEIVLTGTDWEWFMKEYDFDTVEVITMYEGKKEYLPRYYINYVMELYCDKTQLKNVEGQEEKYRLAKAFLNGLYGMMVTNDINDEYSFVNGQWVCTPLTKPEIVKQLEDKAKTDQQFLYQWGVWVTAYARRNLWTMIEEIGDDLVYTDTDSLKMVHSERHLQAIDAYNEDICRKVRKSLIENDIVHASKDESNAEHLIGNAEGVSFPPKTPKGEDAELGIYDHEGDYPVPEFKTLGAKKYFYIDRKGEPHNTIAGCSKKAAKFVASCDRFEDELVIPEKFSMRTCSHFITNGHQIEVTDYLGRKDVFGDKYGICIENVPYTLGITATYKEMINKCRLLEVIH